MGYSTTFIGELKFKEELIASELAYLKKFLGKDRREIGFSGDDAYESEDEYWYHINLELLDDFSGIKWNGSEKTYDLGCIVNFLTKQMRKIKPDFEFTGEMQAQGEDAEDRWVLKMKDGKAIKVDLEIELKECECPHCKYKIKKVLCSECEEEILIGDLK